MRRSIRRLPPTLVALFAGTVATRLGTFVVPFLTVYLAQTRGLSLVTTGQVVAGGGLGMLLGNVAGGRLADVVGRKSTLIAAMVVNVLGLSGLAAPLVSPWAYGLATAVAMFGTGMYTPAANALIADVTQGEQRSLAYTVHYVCINVGMALGPLAGGVLVGVSFRWLFVGDIVTALVCLVILALGVREAPRARSRDDPGARIRFSWRAHTRVVAVCAATFFVVSPLMGLEYAVPLLVSRVLDAPLTFVGAVYTINAVCILTLGLVVERVVRGRDELAMMAVAAGLWTLGLLWLACQLSIVALLLSTAVWTVGEIVGSVVIPTYVAKHAPPHARGRLLGVGDAVRSAAGVVLPIGLGLVWEGVGVSAVLAVLVTLPLIGVVLYGGAYRLQRGRSRR